MKKNNLFDFDEILQDVTRHFTKVKTNEYKSDGKTPIIDQSKKNISGYTDLLPKKNNFTPPYIIFGDHTRCLKYSNEEFILGADGTKVLKSKIDINYRYLFHYLKSLKIKSSGYSRHFKFLKRYKIFIPEKPKQDLIAKIFDKIELIQNLKKSKIYNINSISHNLFYETFGDVIINNKRWKKVKLKELAIFENGDRSKNYPSGDEILKKGILFLSTKNIINNKLDLSNSQYISEKKYKSLARGRARYKDIVITLRGTLGSCCIFTGSKAFINAQMMIIRPKEKLLTNYLYEYLTHPKIKQYLNQIANFGAIPQLTSEKIGNILVPCPPIKTQREFEDKTNKIKKIEEKLDILNLDQEKLFDLLKKNHLIFN
jgi:type I restriction enzyme, S subunit